MKRKYIYLILTLLWISFILYMSSKPAVESAAASSQIVDFILKWFGISSEYSESISFVVRKTAHFTEYFILSGLLTATYGAFTNKKYNYSFILLMGVMTALSDEFLQGFIEGRSSEVRDVLIDFSGVAAFIVVFRVFIYNKIFSSMNY
ncbi:VanZ family protein [Clostridium culturomicium]|uniref:VanZ family protein n=1 Tax=Clostridium culturomicium TaxID=1499683 RepID=UPI0006938312|nr:VanZ family protein [Clostridium culturomicium]